MSRLNDAAFSLVLRTATLPFGSQVLLHPLIVLCRKDPNPEILWCLLERMDRMGHLSPEAYHHHRADLRRLEMAVVSRETPLTAAGESAIVNVGGL